MSRVRSNRRKARIEMRVLLLGATGAEPSFRAWQTALDCAGVPFEAVALGAARSPLTLVGSAGQSRFQALIFATGALTDGPLNRSERLALEALETLEREFGIRRLIAYAYPGPAYGLRAPVWAGPLDGVRASLTSSGRSVFPYLRGPLPIDAGSWGYLAAPVSPERFEPLVAGSDGSALVGIHRRGDGSEEMVQTFDANARQTQSQLLRRGQLAWLTRGSHLGHERNYLSLHIDDVLLPNQIWNAASHATDTDPRAMIRMSAGDGERAASWSRSRGLRLDLVCNGGGSERHAREAGVQVDPLLGALVAGREGFGWINHTYEHLNLDHAPRATIEAEIERNRSWARRAGIELEPGVLVTGEHTGLANLAGTPPRPENPQLAPALAAQGIRYLACDASRPYPLRRLEPGGPCWPPGTPFAVGPALAVPRYPTLLGHDAATPAQAVDRLRSAGVAGATCWEEVRDMEARRIFVAVMSNDPRPHYFHQSNLAAGGPGDAQDGGGGIFYAVLDAAIALYQRYVAPDVPIVQPTLGEIGELLSRRTAWRMALAAGSIESYLEGSRVTIVNHAQTALMVPLSGTDARARNDGLSSGWTRVAPGEAVLDGSAS